jgi:excisionase family DNA binding protein
MKYEIPIWEKGGLTLEEASAYSGIGRDKLYELTEREDCSFVLRVGSKRLIKRIPFDEFIDAAYSI